MTTPKDADSFSRWLYSEEGPAMFRDVEDYEGTLLQAWKASRIHAMRDVLAMLPDKKEEFRQGRYVPGEREWNKCLDEIRAKIEGELKQKEGKNI